MRSTTRSLRIVTSERARVGHAAGEHGGGRLHRTHRLAHFRLGKAAGARAGRSAHRINRPRHTVDRGPEATADDHVVRYCITRFVPEPNAAIDESLETVMYDLNRTLTPVHITIDGVVVAIAGCGGRVRDDALDSLQ